jgi:hypothetical protein
MRVLQTTAAVLVLTLGAATACADGLLYQLPKDGTWATYQFDFSVSHGQYGVQTVKGTIRMASVGVVTENGQPCRWIEVAMEPQFEKGAAPPGGGTKQVIKVLIPENFLAKDQTPLDHAIRAWKWAKGEGEPEKMKDLRDPDDAPIHVILSGPLKDAKQLPKAEVEGKLGKLLCEGVTGSLELKLSGGAMFRYVLENRMHGRAPFGVVTSRWTVVNVKGYKTAGTKQDWNLKLIDFGEDAKSELPDAK